MESESHNYLNDVLSQDNTVRQRAEAELNGQRESNPAALMGLFVKNLGDPNVEVA